MKLTIEISDALFLELLNVIANEPGVSPHGWAAECVEATLATRRLPFVKPSPHGPLARKLENMLDTRPQFAEHRAVGMRAADVPTLGDLDCLADIT